MPLSGARWVVPVVVLCGVLVVGAATAAMVLLVGRLRDRRPRPVLRSAEPGIYAK